MKIWHCALAASALLASGCTSSSVKDTLGLTRAAPDEYRVVSRPPLSVPPQFNLRPPSATEDTLGQVVATDQAHSLMTGSTSASTAVQPVTSSKTSKKAPAMNAADSEFLQKAGAANANPHVREEMVEERYTRIEQQEASPWWDVFDWTADKKDPTVDAKKEAERIKTNEDQGKAVTDGKTPDVKTRDTGLLGKIFDY